jgi:hypothetical protein
VNINNIERHAHQLVLPFSFFDGFLYAPAAKLILYAGCGAEKLEIDNISAVFCQVYF